VVCGSLLINRLPRIRQGGPERHSEPEEVEDRHAGDHRSGKDPRAIAAVERGECGGQRADVRLRAVDDVRDDEEDEDVDAAHAPQAFPEHAIVYPLVDEVIAGWMRS
jgi:hypothetical protein